MDYEPVIGVETHVQLETRTKLFCGCTTLFGHPANSQTCPVCLGLPGALPVLNRQAVELALRASLALDCTIAGHTKFDRKNYFYPDLPKGYQISQYDLPLASNGQVRIGDRSIRVQRVHMEEDAGKLIHEENGARSFVDLNRAGVPLIEIVTHPDLRSADEATAYLTALNSTMRYMAVSNCDMEKGEFRFDVNLSIRPRGSATLGTKTEIKNLNSFRFAAEAIRHETGRQIAKLEAGRAIAQETRSWDPGKKATVVMRTKEDVHDYRYFPEPDLPPLSIPKEEIERIRTALPELAPARKARFMKEHGLSEHDAGVLVSEREIGDYFEGVTAELRSAKSAANWVINEVLKYELRSFRVSPKELASLIGMVETKKITSLSAKNALASMASSGGTASETVRKMGLETVSDTSALEEILNRVIAENPGAVEDYRSGKTATEKFFIGQVMKATRGKADVQVISELLKKKLS